jgi:hypothetical protein
MSASQEWFGMLFAWVVRAGWQASVIVVLVLLMQFLLRRVLSAQ